MVLRLLNECVQCRPSVLVVVIRPQQRVHPSDPVLKGRQQAIGMQTEGYRPRLAQITRVITYTSGRSFEGFFLRNTIE